MSDQSSNNGLKFFIILASGLGGLAAFFSWLENRKSRKLKDEVLALDKQIKQLELGRQRAA